MWVYLHEQRRKGKRSFTKVQQNGWFGHEKQCQRPVLNFNCTTLRKKKRKEVSFENEATLQVKVGGLLVCLSHFGGLEYCCTMVYLPFFLLQYNLLKLSVNKTEFWYYRPAVSEWAQCLLVCVCFNCMSTLDGKVFRVHFMQGHFQSSMYSHRSFSQPS